MEVKYKPSLIGDNYYQSTDDKSINIKDSRLYLDLEEIEEHLKTNFSYIKQTKQSNHNIEEIMIFKTDVVILPPSLIDDNKKAKIQKQYYIKLKKNNNLYEGFSSALFNRLGIGLNHYANNDIYIGHWLDNVREGRGFYKYFFENKFEYYYGNFKADSKFNRGVYYWFKENPMDSDFEHSKFDLMIGCIQDDSFQYGVYINKNEDEVYYYFGFMNKFGQKDDNGGIYYDHLKNRVFYGHIEEDKINLGYLVNLKIHEMLLEEENNKNNELVKIDSNNNELGNIENKDENNKDKCEIKDENIEENSKEENLENNEEEHDINNPKTLKEKKENVIIYIEMEKDSPVDLIKATDLDNYHKESKIKLSIDFKNIITENKWLEEFYNHFKSLNTLIDDFESDNYPKNVFSEFSNDENESRTNSSLYNNNKLLFNDKYNITKIDKLLSEVSYYKLLKKCEGLMESFNNNNNKAK